MQSRNGFSGPVELFALNLPGHRVLPGTAWAPTTLMLSPNAAAGSTLTLVTDALTPTGTFTITFEGRGGGLVRNTTGQITVNVMAPPSLRVDGGTASSKPIGGTFSFTGSGYTPGGTVTRFISPAIAGATVLIPTLTADASGNISWTFTPTCGNPYGTFTVSARDDVTGRTSNNITETVLSSAAAGLQLSSVTPTAVGAGVFDMTISGTGFDSAAIDRVYWKATGALIGSGSFCRGARRGSRFGRI